MKTGPDYLSENGGIFDIKEMYLLTAIYFYEVRTISNLDKIAFVQDTLRLYQSLPLPQRGIKNCWYITIFTVLDNTVTYTVCCCEVPTYIVL